MPHLWIDAVIVHAVGKIVLLFAKQGYRKMRYPLPTACENLPPAALSQIWTALRRPFSFCEKETKHKSERTVRPMAIYHLEAKVVSRGNGR
ncbi:MAG: hypothetical protein V8Q06_00005, partial [Acutalibacteraceae bacterium]